MTNLVCPQCGNPLERVVVNSNFYQTVEINERGVCVEGTWSKGSTGDTISINCMNCDQDLSEIVVEQ